MYNLIYLYTYSFMCVYVCMYVCMYVCVCVYVCMCMYIYIYIHLYHDIKNPGTRAFEHPRGSRGRGSRCSSAGHPSPPSDRLAIAVQKQRFEV